MYRMSRGDTFELDISLKDADGAAWDLTGATVRSTIKKALADTDAVALSQIDSTGASTPTGGSVTVTAATGEINLRHPPAATRALEAAATKVYYDVQVELADGRIFTVDWGTIEVIPDVTVTV